MHLEKAAAPPQSAAVFLVVMYRKMDIHWWCVHETRRQHPV